MPRTFTNRQRALLARAGRAHEDPKEMTRAANEGRTAKFIAAALRKNPDLSPEEARRAGKLLQRAEMTRIAALSVAARKQKTL